MGLVVACWKPLGCKSCLTVRSGLILAPPAGAPPPTDGTRCPEHLLQGPSTDNFTETD